MSVYSREYRLRNKDVNMFMRLRLSRLTEMLQEASIDHTEQLGAGREKTLDRGLLWVVVQQETEIFRMPEYDEQITVQSWPGRTMHVLFPRYYRLLSKNGEVLVQGSSLWTLVDENSRKIVFPDRFGIEIPEETTGFETALPGRPGKRDTDHSRQFQVPFSYCDLNGHMNNTRYFDLAEDTVTLSSSGRIPSRIRTEYANEARFRDIITVSWTEDENTAYIAGDSGKNCFRMCLEYKEQDQK